MNPRRLAQLCAFLGAALVVAGVAIVFPPAALVVAGLSLTALGIEELRQET